MSLETSVPAIEHAPSPARRATAPRRLAVIRPPSLSLAGLRNDLFKLAQYRDLLYTLTVHRVKVRYKQSVLGVAWAVLQPVTLMLIYTVIFSYVAKVQTGDTPYALFAFSALLPWTCFATALTNGTSGLVSHSQLVTKVYFPREILPLTYVLAALFDLLVASITLVALMLYYHARLTPNVLYVGPLLLVLICFSTAMAFFFSATQVRFRDIGVAMPLLLQLWMYATPVVYPLSAVPARLRSLYLLNPMAGVIENFRRVVVQGQPADPYALGLAAGSAVLLLVASYIYFKHVEATIADVI